MGTNPAIRQPLCCRNVLSRVPNQCQVSSAKVPRAMQSRLALDSAQPEGRRLQTGRWRRKRQESAVELAGQS
jgi:hypothetical protein